MPDETDLPAADPAADGVVPVEAAAATRAPQYLGFGLLFVVGLVSAMFGVALVPLRLRLGGVALPVGLLVVVAIPVIARAGAWVMGARLGAGCVALGWALPTIAFVIAGPGGDVLLPDVTRTWIYLLGTALLLVLAVALPLPRGARELAESHGLGSLEP
ncbi:MAG: hypothetical protein U0R76_15650 [Candidatus Nanopelagicales bacterium]